MAALAKQSIVPTGNGLTPVYSAAAGGGDTFAPGDNTFLHVKNTSSQITMTVAVQAGDPGVALLVADNTFVIPATTGDKMCGPFPAQYFADPTDGLADITYTGVTGVTVAVLDLSRR